MEATGVKSPTKFEILVNYGGLERSLEISRHQTIQAVLEHAMNLFEVHANRHTLALFDGNRELTDLNQTVADAGLIEGSKLFLRQSEVRGG